MIFNAVFFKQACSDWLVMFSWQIHGASELLESSFVLMEQFLRNNFLFCP